MVATGRAMSFTRCRWHSPTQKIQRERKKKKPREKHTTERIRSQNNSTFQLGARAQLVGSVGPANPVTGPSFPTTEWTTRYYRTCVTSYTTTTPSPRPCRWAGPGIGDGTLRHCFPHLGPVPFFVKLPAHFACTARCCLVLWRVMSPRDAGNEQRRSCNRRQTVTFSVSYQADISVSYQAGISVSHQAEFSQLNAEPNPSPPSITTTDGKMVLVIVYVCVGGGGGGGAVTVLVSWEPVIYIHI